VFLLGFSGATAVSSTLMLAGVVASASCASCACSSSARYCRSATATSRSRRVSSMVRDGMPCRSRRCASSCPCKIAAALLQLREQRARRVRNHGGAQPRELGLGALQLGVVLRIRLLEFANLGFERERFGQIGAQLGGRFGAIHTGHGEQRFGAHAAIGPGR
jgi:hypothetical protein